MVVKINIGGKERGYYFGMLAMQKMSELLAKDESHSIYAPIYAGLYNYAFGNGSELDFTYFDVIQWVDEVMLDEDAYKPILEAVNKAIAESQGAKKVIDKAIADSDDTKKKKPHGKKSTSSPSAG